MTELVVVLPLMLMLTAGCMTVVWMSWQALRVQQAANLAARMNGQEALAGGTTVPEIDRQNGYQRSSSASIAVPPDPSNVNSDSVYGRYSKRVRLMFPDANNQNLLIWPPEPHLHSYKIKIERIYTPPRVFGLNWGGKQFQFWGVAYGGEDSYMYALPRFGTPANNVGNGSQQFWQTMLEKEKNNHMTQTAAGYQ